MFLFRPTLSSSLPLFFFFYCYGAPRDLHSFPTRRSSDLALHYRQITRPVIRNPPIGDRAAGIDRLDRKSTRLNSSHVAISYAVFCLKKKKKNKNTRQPQHK